MAVVEEQHAVEEFIPGQPSSSSIQKWFSRLFFTGSPVPCTSTETNSEPQAPNSYQNNLWSVRIASQQPVAALISNFRGCWVATYITFSFRQEMFRKESNAQMVERNMIL
jgi:hypothetical protein